MDRIEKLLLFFLTVALLASVRAGAGAMGGDDALAASSPRSAAPDSVDSVLEPVFWKLRGGAL